MAGRRARYFVAWALSRSSAGMTPWLLLTRTEPAFLIEPNVLATSRTKCLNLADNGQALGHVARLQERVFPDWCVYRRRVLPLPSSPPPPLLPPPRPASPRNLPQSVLTGTRYPPRSDLISRIPHLSPICGRLLAQTTTYENPHSLNTMAPRTRKAAASPAPAAHNGDTPPPLPSKDDAPPTPSAGVDALLVPVATEEREEVKVNNASATDMKHACDDALKRVSTPSLSAPCRRSRR